MQLGLTRNGSKWKQIQFYRVLSDFRHLAQKRPNQ